MRARAAPPPHRLTRDRNRKYKCDGCPDDHPCVRVRLFYPLLCAFCLGERVAASPLLANYTKTVFRSQYGTRRRGLRGILCIQRGKRRRAASLSSDPAAPAPRWRLARRPDADARRQRGSAAPRRSGPSPCVAAAVQSSAFTDDDFEPIAGIDIKKERPVFLQEQRRRAPHVRPHEDDKKVGRARRREVRQGRDSGIAMLVGVSSERCSPNQRRSRGTRRPSPG